VSSEYLSQFLCFHPHLSETAADLSVGFELEEGKRVVWISTNPKSCNYLDDGKQFLNSLLFNQEMKDTTACCLVGQLPV